MTSEVGPGFSWLPGVWSQWLTLSYAHLSRLWLSWKNSICLRRSSPGLDVDPLSAWTSFAISKCTLRASGPWEAAYLVRRLRGT